jgi:hypothetical protein
MIRQRFSLAVKATLAFALLFLTAIWYAEGDATSAPQSKADAENQKDSAKSLPGDVGALAGQVKELQNQVAKFQGQVSDMQTPRIVAAGTATFTLGAVQDNATNARVPLKGDVAAKLGDEYIVLLTTRFPTGGYPFFVPYWKRAKDGFDVTLVDVNLGPNSTASYESNRNKTYLIDWIVVKK